MPRLEGLVSTGLRAARAPQSAIVWKNIMREIMFSTSLRDATDWELASDSDVVNAGASGELDASGGTLYGFLVDSIYTDALFVMASGVTDSTLNALVLGDGGALNWGDAGEGILVKIPLGSSTNAQIHGWAIPNGIILSTAVQFMADGDEGVAPTANDVRVHAIYRTATEAHAQAQ